MSSAPESLPCDSVGEAPSELALLALSLVAGSGFLPLGSRSAAAADRDAAGGDRLDEVSMERRMGGWGRRAPAAAPLPLAGAWTVVSLCRATWADSRLLCAEQRLCERRPALAPREAEEARRMTEFGGAAPPAPRTRLAAVASRGDARRLAELLSAYGPRAAAREVAHEDGRLLGRALQSPLTSFVTPLARACHGRHAGAAAALIAAGAPATAAACVAAARSHDAGIVALLLDASAAAADAAAGAWAVGLADAVACGADGIVRLILARKVVPQPDVDGALCLMRISRVTPPGAQPQPVRHVDTARALLDAGAPAGGPPPLPLPVGASDHCALATPLLRAIADGFGEVAHLLLARGADSDAVCCAPDVLRDIPAIRHRGGRDGRRGAGGLRGDDGVTPLHAAVLSDIQRCKMGSEYFYFVN